MKWTENQQKAIFTREKNLLLSAAAGSGKTAVLTERIVQCLLEDRELNIDRMLVVTFTKAATAEMKKRITERIIEVIDDEETSHKDREHLKNQLSLIQNANISTLDSFCGNVVRKFFTISGVDSSTSVGDEGELHMLENDVLDDLLEEYYEEGNENFKVLAGLFYNRMNPDLFRNSILRIYSYILNLSDPFGWLKNTVREYDWKQEFIDYLGKLFSDALSDTEALYEFCGEELAWVSDMKAGLENLRPLIREGKATEGSFEGILPSRANYKGLDGDAEKNTARALYKKAGDSFKEFKTVYSKYSDAEIDAQIKETEPVIEVLTEIIEKYHERLLIEKSRKNVLSFADIVHKALKVLKTKEAADYYKDLFKYVFVDEYQDITEINDAIIDAVSKDNNVFRVGDVKQCIYGFREACPDLFVKKAEDYENCEDGKSELIKLSENFRSRKEVLESVNQIFRRIMSKDTVGVTYNPDDELHPKNGDYKDFSEDGKNPYKSEFIVTQGTNDGARKQAEAIADRISRLIDDEFQVMCKDSEGGISTRNVTFKDFTVLTRNGTHNSTLIEELGRKGIPAYAGKGTSLFENYDIMLLVAFLRIIDNPLQDIPLLTVMRSPLYDFSDEEIARLAAIAEHKTRKNTWLYEILEKASNPKFLKLLNDIKEYAALAQNEYVSTLVWKIMTGTGYYKYVLDNAEESKGLGRQYALRFLFDIASSYEASRKKGLHRFIRHLERLQSEGNTIALSAYASAAADAVCINTIHASKGLEYPVVFLFGARSTNPSGFYGGGNRETKTVVYDRNFGIDIYRFEKEKNVYVPTFRNLLVDQKNKKKVFDEEMRLLYVAMTRAREKLILVGMFPDSAEVGFEDRNLSVREISEAKHYSDWVLKAGGSDLWDIIRISENEADENLDEEETAALFGKKERGSLIPVRIQYEYEKEPEFDNPTEWIYPHEDDKYIKSKISVTDLKRIQQNDDAHVVPYRKSKSERAQKSDSRFTAAEQGTIIHEVLRRLDFKSCLGKSIEEQNAIIEETVSVMAEKGFILPVEREAVDTKLITNFLNSDLGKRAASAEIIEKEIPFTILMDAADTIPGYKGETVMQGIIDCCFIEDGEYVIADYKSDKVTGDEVYERAESYRMQIDSYAAALSRIKGIPVKEKQLFFLREGTAVEIK